MRECKKQRISILIYISYFTYIYKENMNLFNYILEKFYVTCKTITETILWGGVSWNIGCPSSSL